MRSHRCPQAHRFSDICETKKNWCQAFVDPACDKMAQSAQTKHHSSRFGNAETSNRSALHLELRRHSSLHKVLRSNFSKAVALEGVTSYDARAIIPTRLHTPTLNGAAGVRPFTKVFKTWSHYFKSCKGLHLGISD